MGGVYLAKAVGAGGVGKVVAIKLLHEHMAGNEDVVKMFLDEARIASALNHVNVCTTFDFGEHEGVYFLVMEYLEGEPLNRVLKSLQSGIERHPLHPWLIARLLADAAEGLHTAHQLSGTDGRPLEVVHRDVSPHNIFVTYDGVTKVVDFGIARARERSSSTEVGTFKGKFEYASPEQLTAQPVDRRADVWALGVCLWELLTGVRLFKRADYRASAKSVLSEPIPAPSTVSPGVPAVFDEIVARALQREPEKRFPTAREFARALRTALASSGTAIDGPTIEEWLQALFPGDRAKRQALSAAVSHSGPGAPLENVPTALQVSDTVTNSERKFPSSGQPPAPDVSLTAETGSELPVTDRPGARPGVALLALGLLALVALGGVCASFLAPDFFTPPAVTEALPETVVAPPAAAPAPEVEAPRAAPSPPVEALPAPEVEARAVPSPPAPVASLTLPPKKPVRARLAEPVPLPAAPVASPVAAAGGWVHFKTPGGIADVHIDGKKAGATPLSLNLSKGKHTFELKATGMEFGGPQIITVSNGSDFKVEVDLR